MGDKIEERLVACNKSAEMLKDLFEELASLAVDNSQVCSLTRSSSSPSRRLLLMDYTMRACNEGNEEVGAFGDPRPAGNF